MLRIAAILEQALHSETDAEEVLSYLKTFDKLRESVEILNKGQIRRLLQIMKC